MLTLSEALKDNKLNEFIEQEESRGKGPILEESFLLAASKVIKTSQQSDQTSRSPSSDGSTGK